MDNQPDLAAMLRAWASGVPAHQAAVELLIHHGGWPTRLHHDGLIHVHHDLSLASIDWEAVRERLSDTTGGGFAASSSEEVVLNIAASLAGHQPVVLAAMLPRLDATNSMLVLEAVAHASNNGIDVTVQRPYHPGIDDLAGHNN